MKARVVVFAAIMAGMASLAWAGDEGYVRRSMFTTAVIDREPVDNVRKLPPGTATLYFFSDLRNLTGQTITHRWVYRGEVVAEVSFKVGGPRWRVWSTKDVRPSWTGQWTVQVVDGAGNELATDALIIRERPGSAETELAAQSPH